MRNEIKQGDKDPNGKDLCPAVISTITFYPFFNSVKSRYFYYLFIQREVQQEKMTCPTSQNEEIQN